MNTQPKALWLADWLEDEYGSAESWDAAAELRRLHRVELAYQQWSDKTEWVQGTGDGSELGMHIADVLKQRIENLRAANAELVGTLKQAEPMLQSMLDNITRALPQYKKMPALDQVRAAIAKATGEQP
jgi:hypothetical protein